MKESEYVLWKVLKDILMKKGRKVGGKEGNNKGQ